jgi:CheY-like chemotaxis protein
MDIQMPVMDGYEATRRIRSMDSRGKASIPILALTANASGEDKKKALAAGMDGYLNKPVRVQELYDAIKQHI